METRVRTERHIDHGRSLSPAQWSAFKAHVIRHAHAAQAAAIRDAFARWATFMIRTVRRKTRAWHRHRCERRAAAEVRALSDRELRDIAVSRSEIDARVRMQPGGHRQ